MLLKARRIALLTSCRQFAASCHCAAFQLLAADLTAVHPAGRLLQQPDDPCAVAAADQV